MVSLLRLIWEKLLHKSRSRNVFYIVLYHCSDIYSNKELEATEISNTRITDK